MVFYLIKVLFEFLFYIILFSRPEHRNDTSNVNKRVTDENDKMEIPEVTVECKYLPNDDVFTYGGSSKLFNKAYEIDGYVFTEVPFRYETILQEFEIQTENTTDNRSNVLRFSIQETPHGIIINSNILVTENNYHTIISDQEKCVVCDMQVELPGEHIKLDTHKANLDKYKPLNEYDGVIRKINEEYYCSVCNVLFKKTHVDEHYNSINHEEKTLNAVNRASDVLDNINLNNEVNDQLNRYIACDDNDTCNVDCVTSDVKSNVTNNVISNVSGNISDNSSDGSSRKLSYASIAKTPPTPKYIDIMLHGEKVQVKFDSWHMILSTRRNEFTCMACVGLYHISQKAKHCSEQTHLDKLGKCEIVMKYPKHFIRKINERYYHCGNCNELQLCSDIDDHIDFVHLKKQRTTKNNDETIKNNVVKNNVISRNDTVTTNQNEILNQNSSMILSCCYIYINQFYCLLRVSLISYNMVYKRPNDYYCFKCNCVLPELGMRRHIHEQSHIEKLAITPFESYFGVNLIRLVNQSAHCTICNIMFNVQLISAHIYDQMHRILLKQALTTPYNIPPSISHHQPIDATNRVAIESTSTNNSKMELQNKESVETNDLKIESYTGEFVYLKFKNTYAKVTYNAYNSLLCVGDGSCYCFICSQIVFGLLKDHIESPEHVLRLKQFKFIDKNAQHLLRQINTTYHCCNCNVMITKDDLSAHLTFQPFHETKIDKRQRKIDFKSGIKQIDIETKKESHYASNNESNIGIDILTRIDVKPNNNIYLKKMNKIIIYKYTAVKISWDAWQSFYKKNDCYRCYMCQTDVKNYEISTHISNDKHIYLIENTFERNYLPDLLRKVDENILNCLTCGTLVSSKEHIISKHINGKKHKNIKSSLKVNCANIQDSNEDIFRL
ncbi:uncharacterized protein LOC124542169 [Vanessa cardui]|uniref:uncharacterized protein LOC124542169 n=1 Tax=Vanessa cardui TaxID=171605 RepID=UPI001F12BD63|nr:uncharacterized protein LOC124542169 [Vanessa cardui]